MLFWIVAALLTLAASLAVLVPLTRPSTGVRGAVENDIEVYRDQLDEVERDLQRKLIEPAEAEQARAEIGRRILRLDNRFREPGRAARRLSAAVGGAAVLLVPLVSWGLYAMLGSPELPAQPLEARLSKLPSESSPDELVVRAERQLRDHPEDGRGWDVLAPVYMRLGRTNEAVFAYRNAIKLLGDSAERSTGLGMALGDLGGGAVSADARAAFVRALAIDPAYPKARFMLGVAAAQENKFDEAIAGWTELAAAEPEGSEWRQAAEQAIQVAHQRKDAAASPPPAAGPTPADIAASDKLSPEDRAQMIEAMVATLDEKLRSNPADREGWKRLVRSYMVLGREDSARDALARGRAALGETAESGELAQFAASLGLSATE